MNLEMQDYHNVARMMFLKYGKDMIFGDLTEKDMNHIIQVGASVMMTRDKFLQGGSFVQSIVNNDLQGAVNRADSVMRRSLVFMVYLNSHVRAELEIENAKSPTFETI
jgi:hypothetical protein